MATCLHWASRQHGESLPFLCNMSSSGNTTQQKISNSHCSHNWSLAETEDKRATLCSIATSATCRELYSPKTFLNPVDFGEKQKTGKVWSVLKFLGKILTKPCLICSRCKRFSWHAVEKHSCPTICAAARKTSRPPAAKISQEQSSPVLSTAWSRELSTLHSHRLFWASTTSQEEARKWCSSPET